MSRPRLSSRLAARCALALLSAAPAVSHACSVEPYTGEICTTVTSWCPRGYLPADGRVLQASQYQTLFGLLGKTYGGDGVSTFALPDLRGRAPVGSGQPADMQLAVAPGQAVGQQQLVLNTTQIPLVPHGHAATFAGTPGAPVLNATPGTLEVTAALPLGTSADGGPVPPASGKAYLTTISATSGPTKATFSGPYSTIQPATIANTARMRVTTTGAAGTPDVTATVDVPVSGTVTVAPSQVSFQGMPLMTQSPALGLNMCIAISGVWPPQQ